MTSVAILAEAAGRVGTGEAITFWVLTPVALVGAIGMVWARNAVHSALFLVLTMLSLGVFYVLQAGPFIGMVQIIVYTGAIIMLFLFVLMLVGRESSDSVATPARLPDGSFTDRSVSPILPHRELTGAEAAPKGTEK